MIRAVREAISVPYIVAGGILTERELRTAYSSGADIVQIGTAFERTNDAHRLATLFAKVTREEGRKKLKSKR
jgi:NAD(P)H-dependent flavin oxidoreductase YrpB (nitropropane dioxygenase family)